MTTQPPSADPANSIASTPPGLPATQLVASVEARLREAIRDRAEAPGGGLPRRLADAMVYAALGPGKRVRPTLVVRACEAVAGPVDLATPPVGLWEAAAAVELVHAFSLVHDDLPALDDDDLRRGRPTLHRQTDEATAILAGDALLTLSTELLATGVADPGLALRLIGELSVATQNMIAGQTRDTRPEPTDAGRDAAAAGLAAVDQLTLIHRQKTAALLRAAVRLGGLCGAADEPRLRALTDYAEAVGLMFQVVDDLLDVTSDGQTLGKATQKDAAAGKLTYPGLMGVDGARAEAARLHEAATDALRPLGEHGRPLREIADQLAVRQY